jgi:prepilin-type N-terminal cleavage/methylation domain-containing protein
MPTSNKGFTLFEIVTVMMLIGVVSLVGTSMAKQYKLATESRYTNQDLLVIQRGLRDRWLAGTACISTMPAGLPTTSPYGTIYNVNCYQQGFGVDVDLPTEIAQGMVLPNSKLTVVSASTTNLSVSESAPFISDGGYYNRNVYISY